MEPKVIYGNNISIILSDIDCNLAIRTVVPIQNANGQVIANQVLESINVYLSLEHAKMISQLLDKQLKNYELSHGPIYTPVMPDTIGMRINLNDLQAQPSNEESMPK